MEKIIVEKSTEPANYPFVVVVRNTENWNSEASFVSMAAAESKLLEIQKQFPGLPSKIIHHIGGLVVVGAAPVYRKANPGEEPYDVALWTGCVDVPGFMQDVNIRLNGIGQATVVGYAVLDGYLGVMTKANEATRPEWHKRQNPNNEPGLTFGIEISPP